MQLENLKKKKNHRIIRTECGILDNANSYKVWEKYERDRINKGWNSRKIKSAEVNRIYTNGFFDGDLHMSWFRELMLMTTRLKIGTNSWLSSASATTHNKCARHRPPVGPRSNWNHWCVSTLCGWWAFWIFFVIWGRGYFCVLFGCVGGKRNVTSDFPTFSHCTVQGEGVEYPIWKKYLLFYH